jgi:hypothetical protein
LLLAIHGDSRPVAGRVTVAGASHTWHLDVGSNGAFDASLPHGEYVVTGQSPMFIVNGEEGECRSANSPTTIGGGRTTQVDVVCQGL